MIMATALEIRYNQYKRRLSISLGIDALVLSTHPVPDTSKPGSYGHI